MHCANVLEILEQLAPLSLAESWDNVGLLLGSSEGEVTRILICLTLTPDVAAEAVETGSQLVVTHHPVLFKPVQRVTADTVEGRTLLELARHNVSVYSSHTAWDNAPLGINQQLAELLELTDVRPLRPQPVPDHVKIITCVPNEQLAAVQQALWMAGAGELGNYHHCSYVLQGEGTFFGSDAANPAVGQAGRLERVAEARLEVICPVAQLAGALAALRQAHPYEEPAIDVYPLQPLGTSSLGSGRAGTLSAPLPLKDLAARIGECLPDARVEMIGDQAASIASLGIACGAAAEFWNDAQRAGCQALLTGEARFHDAIAVRDAGFAMILAGHYATERLGMERMAQLLAERCPGVTVTASDDERDPLGV
jgi:dinuclear metal center YbgI/SA1388 family protein